MEVISTVMVGVTKEISMKGIIGRVMVNASQNIKLVMECVMKIIANVMGGVIKRMSMKGIFKIVTENASAIKKPVEVSKPCILSYILLYYFIYLSNS